MQRIGGKISWTVSSFLKSSNHAHHVKVKMHDLTVDDHTTYCSFPRIAFGIDRAHLHGLCHSKSILQSSPYTEECLPRLKDDGAFRPKDSILNRDMLDYDIV